MICRAKFNADIAVSELLKIDMTALLAIEYPWFMP